MSRSYNAKHKKKQVTKHTSPRLRTDRKRKRRIKPRTHAAPVLKNFFVRAPTGTIWSNPIIAADTKEVRVEARRLASTRYVRSMDGCYKILDGNDDEAKVLDRFMFRRTVHGRQ